MEFILHKDEPGLRQDLLIYGKEYHVWRDSEYLGTAIYTDDKHHGDVFLRKKILSGGHEGFEVFCVDEWKLK